MEVVSGLLVTEIWELGLPQTLYFSHSENVEFFWVPQTSVPFAGAFSMIHSVCLLVHWEDPEGWDGEGGGRGDWDGEHM